MHPERVYRTESGNYSESELGILVWINPDFEKGKNSRLLMTMTDYSSSAPMAFPLSTLRKSPFFEKFTVSTTENLPQDMLQATQERPVIIPLPVARQNLGWDDFFVPTRYTEPKL
jgi:hypothetical protein